MSSLLPWQRSNILSALNYLKELARTKDARAETLVQGLAEVLEPARRTVRLQREAAQAADTGTAARIGGRTGAERRHPSADRRQKQAPFDGRDRRSGSDRRAKNRRTMSY